jgi:hypothetical protein
MLACGVGHGRRLPVEQEGVKQQGGEGLVWQDRAKGWVQPVLDCKSLIDDRSKGCGVKLHYLKKVAFRAVREGTQ